MAKKFTAHVHLLHDAEVVSFAPGDDLPKWAESLVTNPDAFEEVEAVAKPTGTDGAGGTGADELDGLKAAELKAIAKELGLPAKGKNDDLKAAIRAKRAAGAPAASGAETGEASPGGEPAGEEATGRAALEAKAKEQGVEFDAETSDEELALLLNGE